MICGTSTGSILASSLAQGKSLDTIKHLYKDNAKSIFPNPMPTSTIRLILWGFKNLLKPSGNKVKLVELLEEVFGNTTLVDVWEQRRIALCIPSVNAGTHKYNIFKTPHYSDANGCNIKLKDACLASSAAPIFFPLAGIPDLKDANNDEHSMHVDGGLWANNPVLIGLTEALALSANNQPIEIYSIGVPTLSSADIEFIKKPKKGIYHWRAGIDIVKMSLFSQSSGYDYTAKSLAKSLEKLDKNVKIYRFPETQPSPSQLKALDLDRSNEDAFKVMKILAEDVVNKIEEEARNNPSSIYGSIKNAFSNLNSIVMS